MIYKKDNFNPEKYDVSNALVLITNFMQRQSGKLIKLDKPICCDYYFDIHYVKWHSGNVVFSEQYDTSKFYNVSAFNLSCQQIEELAKALRNLNFTFVKHRTREVIGMPHYISKRDCFETRDIFKTDYYRWNDEQESVIDNICDIVVKNGVRVDYSYGYYKLKLPKPIYVKWINGTPGWIVKTKINELMCVLDKDGKPTCGLDLVRCEAEKNPIPVYPKCNVNDIKRILNLLRDK